MYLDKKIPDHFTSNLFSKIYTQSHGMYSIVWKLINYAVSNMVLSFNLSYGKISEILELEG